MAEDGAGSQFNFVDGEGMSQDQFNFVDVDDVPRDGGQADEAGGGSDFEDDAGGFDDGEAGTGGGGSVGNFDEDGEGASVEQTADELRELQRGERRAHVIHEQVSQLRAQHARGLQDARQAQQAEQTVMTRGAAAAGWVWVGRSKSTASLATKKPTAPS